MTRTELQAAADASVLAAVSELDEFDSGQCVSVAQQFAALNDPHDGSNSSILASAAVVPGIWDTDSRTFTPLGISETPNALEVTLRRSEANGNPLALFFAGVLGKSTADVEVSAVALAESYPGNFPMCLRTPGWTNVHPKNPFKPGPSMPANGDYFEVGEEVILGFNGKGNMGGVTVTLDMVPAPGYEYQLSDLLGGKATWRAGPPRQLSLVYKRPLTLTGGMTSMQRGVCGGPTTTSSVT